MIKISFETISLFLEKYYKLILGIIFILLLCLNVFIYYKYVYLADKMEANATIESVSVNEEVLNKVLEEIDFREKTLMRVETNKYFDPFN
ncbi:MAG: hypothetical protein U9P63_00535 [Patescibacteria group bacterium]|nr:hypothetical protein [Patescibacteria group bacterium]